MKHTQSPWSYAPTGEVMQGYSQPFGIAQLGTKNLVAGVFGDVKGGEDVAKANAKLIAAAPDLLEALQIVYDHVKYHGLPIGSGAYDIMTKAIKKATE